MKKKDERLESEKQPATGQKARRPKAVSSRTSPGRQLELFATDADGRLAPEAWEVKPAVLSSRPTSSSKQVVLSQCEKKSECKKAPECKKASERKKVVLHENVAERKKVTESKQLSERKTVSRRKSSSPRVQASKTSPTPPCKRVSSSKPLPAWCRYLLMGLFAVVFAGAFYYFFIRPYSYRWKPCYGLKAYGICMPYGYKVHGIDISHHQGSIDWNHLRQTRQGPFPIQFIFLKASEGGDYSDPTFAAHFDSARAHGFIRGAYHFYNPKTDPVRQADFFIRSVQLDAGDLPPVLDIEKRGKDERILRRDLKIWLDRIERHYGVKPILYTSYKFKTRYLNDSVFNSYPYWIAHYYVDSVEYQGPWKFWQHTDVGTLPGITEQVDLNIFNGSLEELKQLVIPTEDLSADTRKKTVNP